MAKTPQWALERIRECREQQLRTLDLSASLRFGDQKLSKIPRESLGLTQLTELNVSGNQLTALPESLGQLTQLTELNVSGNQLTALPESLGQLARLDRLDVSDNWLTVLPQSLGQLSRLTVLSVGRNPHLALPEWLGRLTQLTCLDVRGISLETLPKCLQQCSQLTSLSARANWLTALPEWLGQLTQLTNLDVCGNRLPTIPESLGQLAHLETLDVSMNQLVALPKSLRRLVQLTWLDVSRNQLTALPESLGQLAQLTNLDVSGNQLTALPESLGQLTQLTTLDVSSNQITALPASIMRLEQLNTLLANENPLETPPLEVVARGPQAVREYFRQLEAQGQDRIYEAKLLIVGDAGAGKTTLMRKIMDPGYELRDEPSTKGIEVNAWSFPLPDGRPFRVNLWDFGGQEIYKATHQFFLTKRSLYALVDDAREQKTDFYFWLNAVELLSDGSPLLIIKNEKQDRHHEIDELALRGEFGNLKEVLATNLATNRGLEQVVREIQHYITQLPLVGATLPKTWVRVRQALEADPRNHMPLSEYLALCRDNGFEREEDALQLSGYLHDLGVCLHFQEDPLLNKTVILKPEWGTTAVYRALDDPGVIRNLGRFSRSDLKTIWAEERWAPMRDELLQLMTRFRLCYELPGNRGEYIAPQLLTQNKPDYAWDDADNLHLRYSYEFMPKGILTRFIVATHPYIEDQRCVWLSGVALAKGGARAEVIERYPQREVRVRVSGVNKRDLMTIVAYEMEQIHSSFNRLKYKTCVPCNCAACRTASEPHFYDLEVLHRFLATGKEIQCQKSAEMVNPRSLLDDIFPERRSAHRDGKKPPFVGQAETVIITMGQGDKPMPGKPTSEIRSSWANGSFYLFAFVVVVAALGVLARSVPVYVFPLILVATPILATLIGVLQLKSDKNLSEKSTVELVRIVLGQLPLIGKLAHKNTDNKGNKS